MNPNELIDEYMTGQLNAADKAAFEQAMLNDAELRNLVDNYQGLRQVSSGILEAELLSLVQGVSQAAAPQQPQRANFSKKYLLVAALLLALAAAIFFISKGDKQWEETLTAYHETVRPIYNGTTRSTEIRDLPPFQQAQFFFDNNKYKKSIVILTDLLEKNTNPEELKSINYLLGHAYFKAKKYDQAEMIFNQNQFPQSPCMLALCAVGKKEKSIAALEIACGKLTSIDDIK